jgi:hypothetical protein
LRASSGAGRCWPPRHTHRSSSANICPASEVRTDAQIRDYVRQWAKTDYHPWVPARWAKTTWPW